MQSVVLHNPLLTGQSCPPWGEDIHLTKGGKEDTVSIDRLKPAYLENAENIHRFNRLNQEKRPDRDMSSSPRPTVVPTRDGHPRTTRSGRHVKLPERLQVSEMHRPSVPSRLGGG